MMIEKLWSTTISKCIWNETIPKLKTIKDMLSKDQPHNYDNHSVDWQQHQHFNDLKCFIEQHCQKWINYVVDENIKWTMSSSIVIKTAPMQSISLQTNHNSELIAIFTVETGLENGVALNIPVYPKEIYPINTPLCSPKKQNSIILNDPRGISMTIKEHGSNLNYEIEPEAGQLLLFPSYVQWYTTPNVGKNNRTYIICNIEIE